MPDVHNAILRFSSSSTDFGLAGRLISRSRPLTVRCLLNVSMTGALFLPRSSYILFNVGPFLDLRLFDPETVDTHRFKFGSCVVLTACIIDGYFLILCPHTRRYSILPKQLALIQLVRSN